jgi:PPM family protein phosphatase
MRFSVFQDSDTGARKINQDRMGYSYTREAILLIVADGLGGHARGEVAAQIAVQTVAELFQNAAKPHLLNPAAFLEMSFKAAHRAILTYRNVEQMIESPRTTLVAAVIQSDGAWWAHAGDSRLYWLRGGNLKLRTLDHSKVESLVTMGVIPASAAATHPDRNKVLNCLGSPFEPMVEVSTLALLEPDDALVLCSDGFWSGLTETQLVAGVSQAALAENLPKLVKQAVENNNPNADNTTAVVLQWEPSAQTISKDLQSDLLPEGALTTTIMMRGVDVEIDDSKPLSDEDIENTIAEINAALKPR